MPIATSIYNIHKLIYPPFNQYILNHFNQLYILFLANCFNFLSYAARLFLNIIAASTFAGDSKLGSANIEITLNNIC
jgi:hypothetical protein